MTTPPLLRKMNEVPVGELVIYGDRIIEPRTGCVIARDFPSRQKAIDAATAMNEIADWPGIIKCRAGGRRPNCQGEIKAIIEAHGGSVGGNADARTIEACKRVAQSLDSALAPGGGT